MAPLSELPAQGFAIIPFDDGVTVVGADGIGVLYGVYRLLEHLGFWWFDPAQSHIPTLRDDDLQAWRIIVEAPRARWRGFHTYDRSAPPEFLVWMARNRLNLVGPAEAGLAHKLGISRLAASHDFLAEELSPPELFSEHSDWYGSHNFRRQRIERGDSYFNPAFANPEMGHYVGERLVERLATGDLAWADLLAVWPADARSGTFDESLRARRLGNQSDNLLHFYLMVSQAVREGRISGFLTRPVTVTGISYYETWVPPTNQDITTALSGFDFVQVFHMNERDWHSPVMRPDAWNEPNRRLLTSLDAWQSADLPGGTMEYYNYSILGDLAVTDLPHMFSNIRASTAVNHELFAYMHPLLEEAGPRRLLDVGMAHATWSSNVQESQESFLARYFAARYGVLATQWLAVHRMIASSLRNVRQMFLFTSLEGLLFQHRNYDRPPYEIDEVLAFLERYENGGNRRLPGRIDMLEEEPNSFVGLRESLAIQRLARQRWQAIQAGMPAALRPVIDEDVQWFESTLRRYELLEETVAMYRALFAPPEVNEAESERRASRILALCDSLDTSLLRAAVSGLDQSFVLTPYRSFANEVLRQVN